MKPGNIIGIGLLIGGGYFLLKQLGYLDEEVLVPNTTTNTTNTTQTTTQVTQQTTLQQVATKASSSNVNPNSYQSVDTWNFFYKLVRGLDAPSPEDLFPGADRNKNYSIQEWWAAMTTKGFSGMGMGVIATRVNPYNPYDPSVVQPTGNGNLVRQNLTSGERLLIRMS